MAHYAKVCDGKVLRVIVADEDYINSFVDTEPGNWIQTSYNTRGGVHVLGGTPLRKNYAGIGYTYDSGRDAFISPKPFASWTLDDNFDWQPPTPQPVEGFWSWNEETLSWIERGE
jgi:hypothetical protein